MKLLIVFSALCLVTVTSKPGVEAVENLIPNFLAKCPESIYLSNIGHNWTLYYTVCSLKDYIGDLQPCPRGVDYIEPDRISACAYDFTSNPSTDVAFYEIILKAHVYDIVQTKEDLKKIKPDARIEKSCENAREYPETEFCALKYA